MVLANNGFGAGLKGEGTAIFWVCLRWVQVPVSYTHLTLPTILRV